MSAILRSMMEQSIEEAKLAFGKSELETMSGDEINDLHDTYYRTIDGISGLVEVLTQFADRTPAFKKIYKDVSKAIKLIEATEIGRVL